ncbi:MAG: ATP-binding protein [Acidobacteriota bacterium]|nr:ATP-binding protein [Acidobacteriota bacterium]
MGNKPDTGQTYRLEWNYQQRLLEEHFGKNKYSSTTRAIGELVANSFDAGATTVDIRVVANELGGVQSILVSDDGRGISPSDLKERFVWVGVNPTGTSNVSFGRFGVGRLASFRIGSLSRWTSISQSSNSTRKRVSFELRSGTYEPLTVREELAASGEATGTQIEIFNIFDSGQQTPTASRISNDLLTQFCTYLLGNPSKRINVQGEVFEIEQMIDHRDIEDIPASEQVPTNATINHLILKTVIERSRFGEQLIFSAKGRTVASAVLEQPPSSRYLGLVECPYLDSIVTSNREALIEMDGGFASLKEAALGKVAEFGSRYRDKRKHEFIERARQEEYYPYKGVPTDAVVGIHQRVYDVVLEKVNEHANIENMSKRQQEVVFKLLQRSLENENVLEVLHEVAKLSDQDMEMFREVLERTTLDSIIKLSSEVTSRLAFLDVLHELVYGDFSKHLKERSQLHRIIEPHCWVFGPEFHLATSDESFRKIIKKHRELAGLENIHDEQINTISGIADIPDLFMAATREFPTHPKQFHVLTEIKAPTVHLGKKEREQIRRYAETILESSEFDTISTRWDLFLVSAKVSGEIQRDREQKDKPVGCLWEWENMTVWAFQWSEIIARAREEMHLVRQHLQRKSEELSVSEYLRKNFPDILGHWNSPPAATE